MRGAAALWAMRCAKVSVLHRPLHQERKLPWAGNRCVAPWLRVFIALSQLLCRRVGNGSEPKATQRFSPYSASKDGDR